MTGYEADEIVGETPRILQGPRTDRAVLDRLRRELESARPFSGQTFNYRKVGTEYVLDWAIAPVVDATGQLTHYVSVQRDATERRIEEQRLRDSEERLELALRGAELGLWDYNIEHDRVTYDQRWAGMLGYSADEIQPTFSGWSSRVHPDDLPATLQTLERHRAGKTPLYEAEFRMQTRQGEWRWILARGKVIARSEDSTPVRPALIGI